MTLSRKLREAVRAKMNNIGSRQLLNRISAKAREAGIADRDVALLLLAHEKGIDVIKPRYAVPPEKIEKLNEYLKSQNLLVVPVTAPSKKGAGKAKQAPFKRLLNFKGKYPEVFYDSLEEEINTAYNNPKLPNAVLMLTRKLIENLAYNLLEYKFGKQGKIELYYSKDHRRAHDFSILLENLKNNKSQYDADQHEMIDKFLEMVKPFKRDADSKVHKIMEYLKIMKQVDTLKVPEMVQILLKLIDRVK